jgi:hypothetical protein
VQKATLITSKLTPIRRYADTIPPDSCCPVHFLFATPQISM